MVVPSETRFGFEEALIALAHLLKLFEVIDVRLAPPTDDGTLDGFILYFQSPFGSFQLVAPTTADEGLSSHTAAVEELGFAFGSFGSWTKTRTLRFGRPGTA